MRQGHRLQSLVNRENRNKIGVTLSPHAKAQQLLTNKKKTITVQYRRFGNKAHDAQEKSNNSKNYPQNKNIHEPLRVLTHSQLNANKNNACSFESSELEIFQKPCIPLDSQNSIDGFQDEAFKQFGSIPSAFQTQICQLKVINQKLQNRIIECQGELNKNQKLSQEFDQLKNKHYILVNQHQQLNNQHIDFTGKHYKLVEQHHELNKQHHQLNKQHYQLNIKHQKLIQEYNQLTQNYDEVIQKYDFLRKQMYVALEENLNGEFNETNQYLSKAYKKLKGGRKDEYEVVSLEDFQKSCLETQYYSVNLTFQETIKEKIKSLSADLMEISIKLEQSERNNEMLAIKHKTDINNQMMAVEDRVKTAINNLEVHLTKQIGSIKDSKRWQNFTACSEKPSPDSSESCGSQELQNMKQNCRKQALDQRELAHCFSVASFPSSHLVSIDQITEESDSAREEKFKEKLFSDFIQSNTQPLSQKIKAGVNQFESNFANSNNKGEESMQENGENEELTKNLDFLLSSSNQSSINGENEQNGFFSNDIKAISQIKQDIMGKINPEKEHNLLEVLTSIEPILKQLGSLSKPQYPNDSRKIQNHLKSLHKKLQCLHSQNPFRQLGKK